MNLVAQPRWIPAEFTPAEKESRPDFARVMMASRAAQARWSATSLTRRLQLIRELRRLIAENALALAEASAGARHRPAIESLAAEVAPLTEACRFLERHAGKILATRRLRSYDRPIWLAGIKSEIRRDPLGVILIIGPGNYPLLLPGVQTIQALAAGNSVLLKPGRGGGPAARALQGLAIRAGFDPELISLVDESVDAARAAIEAGPDKVLFTGSSTHGENVLAQLAPQLIPATMELGGCDAVIVRDDADLTLVTKALVFGLTLNGGQTCMSPKRVFVHASVAPELEQRLARSLQNVNKNENAAATPRFHLDPALAAKNLRPLIRDACVQGARLMAGGISEEGIIDAPLALGGVSPSCALLDEDIFLPFLAIVPVLNDQEALSRANDCPFALTVSIFSRDESFACSMAARVRAGSVMVNDLIVPTADPRLPFGGRGRSGFGSTRGAEGLLELTAPKVVTVSRAKFRPAFERPHPADQAIFEAYLKLVHGRGLKGRVAALFSLFSSIRRRRKTA